MYKARSALLRCVSAAADFCALLRCVSLRAALLKKTLTCAPNFFSTFFVDSNMPVTDILWHDDCFAKKRAKKPKRAIFSPPPDDFSLFA